jgi:SAM-dependent methyltransferase
MQNEYPKNIARFYDVIYNSLRDGVDNPYYFEKITATKGTILEVGAGTGRLFIPSLKNGADIYAIDNSRFMLERLKQKIDSKFYFRLELQDVRDIKLEKRFDLIIAPFRVFSHLLTIEDQMTALNSIFQHLNPGGRFIFDLYVPDLDLLLHGFKNHIDFEGEYEPGLLLRRIVDTSSDLINQITHITFTLEWMEKNKLQNMKWEFDFRYFFRYEIEHLIKLSQFNSFAIFGDFKEQALLTESKEFIIHCMKS